jgi:hypothetical protein
MRVTAIKYLVSATMVFLIPSIDRLLLFLWGYGVIPGGVVMLFGRSFARMTPALCLIGMAFVMSRFTKHKPEPRVILVSAVGTVLMS